MLRGRLMAASPPPPSAGPRRRRAAAPYKAALGSLGPRYIRAGLLYKAGLVGRGAAGLGPGKGVHPSSPHSEEVRHPPSPHLTTTRGWEANKQDC